MGRLIETISTFLRETIWLERRGARRAVTFSVRLLRVVVLVGKGFYDDKCFLRASALSFTTVLSLVPLLAFAFSLLKGFGAEQTARGYVLDYVSAQREEIRDQLEGYIDNVAVYVEKTKGTALGTFSLVFLLWTVVKVLSTVETSFNDIWGLARPRTWLRKVADYTSVLVIAPVLILVAIGISAYLSANPLSQLAVPPGLAKYFGRAAAWLGLHALVVIAFSAFYAFMPNTRVAFKACLVGGLVGGTLWRITFWVYATFQVSLAKYNVIYGGFAALPFFLGWLYASWVVNLFGAQVAFAYEHVDAYRQQMQEYDVSPAGRERIALRVFLEIARAFHRGTEAPGAGRLGRELNLPQQIVEEIADILAGAGLVSKVQADKSTVFQPARELGAITPGDVIGAVRSHGKSVTVADEDSLWKETVSIADGFEARLGQESLSTSIAEILGRKD